MEAIAGRLELPWELPDRGPVAMWCLIAAESAIFVIFIVAYLFYAGKSLSGPRAEDVLRAPIFYSVCLISSSITVHFAVKALKAGSRSFTAWLAATIALGATFLAGTGLEWDRLIYRDGLTISTNLLGTTYYSLVGLHGFHVTVGLLALTTLLLLTLRGYVGSEHVQRVDVLALYWHFVDAVWVVVFLVVYVFGR